MASRVNLESNAMVGMLPVSKGGTGVGTIANVLAALVAVGAMNLASDQTVTGVKTFSSAITASAGVTGNLTGNVTGNVSGTAANVTGVVAIANGGTGSATRIFVTTTGDETVAGAKTFSSTITASSGVTGNVTGDVTGDVTGNLTGDVTGDVSGTALNVTGIVSSENGGTGTDTSLATAGQILTAVGDGTWEAADATGLVLSVDGDGVTIETIDGTTGTVELKVKDGGIDTAQLANDAITAAKLANNAVDTTAIANDAVTADKIADAAIDAATKIVDGIVSNVKLVNSSLSFNAGTSLTGGGTVSLGGSATIGVSAGGITATQLGSLAVTTAKIDTGAVTDVKLASDSVTTAKILDANVTTVKLADDAVTADKIADGAIDDEAKLATGVVTPAKLEIGTSLQFLRTNVGATSAEWASISYTGGQGTLSVEGEAAYDDVVAEAGDVQDGEVRVLLLDIYAKLQTLGLFA